MFARRTASTSPWKSPSPVGSVIARAASSNRHRPTCGTHWSRPFFHWPVTKGVAASAIAPRASIAGGALYGRGVTTPSGGRLVRQELHDAERVVGHRAVAGVDRAGRPDLARGAGPLDSRELREHGH